jgi:hypothetical protein
VKAYLQYLKYVLVHKYFVFVAGLKTKAPIWLLLIHDWSKFLPSEFIPYAQYFYGEDLKLKESYQTFTFYGIEENVPFGYFARDRFNVAWLYHQRRNPHHWQYWYLIQDSDPNFAIPMPEKYVREMVADWAGAGRAITGKWEVSAWYEKNKEKILLHPETRSLVENLYRVWRNVYQTSGYLAFQMDSNQCPSLLATRWELSTFRHIV